MTKKHGEKIAIRKRMDETGERFTTARGKVLGKGAPKALSADVIVMDQILAKFSPPKEGDATFWREAAVALLTTAGRLIEALGEVPTAQGIIEMAIDKEGMEERRDELSKKRPDHPALKILGYFWDTFYGSMETAAVVALNIATEARKIGLYPDSNTPFELFVRDQIFPLMNWNRGAGDTTFWDDMAQERLYAAAMVLHMLGRPLEVDSVIDLAMDPKRFQAEADQAPPSSPYASRLKLFIAGSRGIEVVNATIFQLGLRLGMWAPAKAV